jgi:PAS domain S-box-containing protein
MNTRTIVLILALLTLISTATGGYLYYHSIQKAAVKGIDSNFAQATEDLKDNIIRAIAINQSQVKAMSLLVRIQKALLNQEQETLSQANRALDDFAEGFALDVCYLMDSSGKPIASSNRNDQDSFVGHNYSFRPYFTEAIKGKPVIYMALGLTSGSRGIFVSHPVYSAAGGQPIGVVVIKASARELDKALSRNKKGISLLIHSSGIIFASNQENLILKLFSKPSPEELLRIAKTEQFGKGPWNWSGFEEKADKKVVDSSGEIYLIQEVGLADCPGWKIVSLYSVRAIYGNINPFVGKAGYVAIPLCLLFVGAVIVLYVMAQRDITERKRAEESLKETTAFLNTLLNAIPAPIFYKDTDGRYIGFNKSFEEFFGKTKQELVGKSVFDISPRELAEVYHAKDLGLLHNPGTQVYDFQVKDTRGVVRDVVFHKSTFCDSQGEVLGLIGAILDITERKRMEQEKANLIIELQKSLSEIKQLSRILPICASCKKIRDDEGYWKEVETYISDHSEAQFSHGICPDCIRKLYPEIADEMFGHSEKDKKK